jgi:SAM-dependent methyltransferase
MKFRVVTQKSKEVYHRFRGDSYTREFFLHQHELARRSADVVVPLVMQLVEPRSVVDVGCGSGAWLAAFADRGVEQILGIDSEAVPPDVLAVPSSVMCTWDLTSPLRLDSTFDLVLCLEVVEHLPQDAGVHLISTLTDLGPFVLFSAAIPQQGGTRHLNEQWQDYWAEAFADRGYVAVDCLRRKVWNDPAVAWWYAQNMLLFAEKASLRGRPALRRELELMGRSQLSIVHPRCYESWRRALRGFLRARRFP